ncbi:MAG TPA: ribbon-helix-helix domain-containing protein [Casimicrobiaceae bacterium]|nr:ribbon-helix-helix domain-containing protein [Casimicrobiaceae bacterium]
MAAAVKKTISLPADLAREAEALAKAEGKTLSAVIQDALRQARVGRRIQELHGIQGYWSRLLFLASLVILPSPGFLIIY